MNSLHSKQLQMLMMPRTALCSILVNQPEDLSRMIWYKWTQIQEEIVEKVIQLNLEIVRPQSLF